MELDEGGIPPLRTRGRRAEPIWHVYVLEVEPRERSSWIYSYRGTEEADPVTP
ncbi:hypothetical protein [Frankia sp. R43]|uniref:hypothetical protein n=1 Tax=Frankia sp. R43 TaxID=269536 RepID=UPI001379EF86|nr:hypothetical protein [Frankia sp. R43]